MTQRLALPSQFPAVGTGSVLLASLAYAAAVGSLAFPLVLAVGLGVPLGLLALAFPRATIALLIVSIPFSTWTQVPAGAFDVNATDVLVGVLISGWILRAIVRRELVIRGGAIGLALAGILGVAAISSLMVGDFPAAAKEVIKLGEMATVMLYVSSNVSTDAETELILVTSLLAGAAEALVGLFQFATGRGPDSFALGPFIRAYGDFKQPNAFAGYLGLLFPLGVALALRPGRWRWLALVTTGMIGLGLLASFSRGAWLGVGLGAAVMAIGWGQSARRGLALTAGAVLIAVVLVRAGVVPATLADRFSSVLDNFSVFDVTGVKPDRENWAVIERMAHWQAGWGMALAHPVFGVGPGNYEAAYPDYFVPGWKEPLGHAHNYYINTFAELGVVGLVALATLLAAVSARLIGGIRLLRARGSQSAGLPRSLSWTVLLGATAATVTFCVHNTFDNMFVHGIGVQFALILGLVESHCRAIAQENPPLLNPPPPGGRERVSTMET